MPGDPFALHAGLFGEVLVIEQIALVLLVLVRLGAVCLFELYPIGILHVGERGTFIDLGLSGGKTGFAAYFGKVLEHRYKLVFRQHGCRRFRGGYGRLCPGGLNARLFRLRGNLLMRALQLAIIAWRAAGQLAFERIAGCRLGCRNLFGASSFRGSGFLNRRHGLDCMLIGGGLIAPIVILILLPIVFLEFDAELAGSEVFQ